MPRQPRVKIADNLFKIGDVYHYRKGDFEERLGEFKTDHRSTADEKAIKRKEAFEAKRDNLGAEAYGWRVIDLFPDYLKERKDQVDGKIKGKPRISERTYEEIDEKWNGHLKRFFGQKKLSDIDDVLWNQYVKKSKVSDLTNHRKVLKTFLKWCMQNGKIRFLPILEIPQVKRKRRKVLTPDQIKSLFSVASITMILFCALYLIQGMRWTEIVKLEWPDIDFDRDVIWVRDETTRTRTGRNFRMNAQVKQLLLQRRKQQLESGIKTKFVFPGRWAPDRHIHWQAPMALWYRTIDKAGLDGLGLRPHDLRATAEYYADKLAEFSDTQREKHFGASTKTQAKHYITYDAQDLMGLENVVTDAIELFSNSTQLESTKKNKAGNEPGTASIASRAQKEKGHA